METKPFKVELTWADLVEFEVRKKFGEEATIRQVVELMHELGWKPPSSDRTTR